MFILSIDIRFLRAGDVAELQTFRGVMDLPKPVSEVSLNKMNKTMNKAACSVQKQSMEAAAIIEHCLAEDIGDERDVDISVNGTYMTRGHCQTLVFRR